MQGLFYSVTATFTTLVLALVLFVVDYYQESSSPELVDAQLTKAQAIDLLEALQQDIYNMVPPDQAASFKCHVSMTRNGRTKQFTFPTLHRPGNGEAPRVVQVTYALQGQARQVRTRNGLRDLYRLRRTLTDGSMTDIRGGSTGQIVDFLVELVPNQTPGSPAERIVSGGCPADLDEVYIEFHVAVNNAPTYATVSRYSSTIDRPTVFKMTTIP